MKLLAALKERLQHRCFLVNFTKVLKTNFSRTPPYDCFWIEYKHNNTKMIQINIKHDYILTHFIYLVTSKCCSSLLLKTTFRSSRSQMFFKIVVHRKISQENTCVGTTRLLKRDSSSGFFP